MTSPSSTPAPGPLRGVQVLVGRTRHQASALSAGLKDLGAEVIEIPFLEIRKPRSYKPLDTALGHIQQYHWLILTSANGVAALAARMQHLQIARAKLEHLKIAAIGPATQEEIEKLGLEVSVVPNRYVAEAVVQTLAKHARGQRILLARAKVARDVIPRELRKLGAEVDVVEAYETVAPESSRARLEALFENARNRPDVITFASSSSVKNFVALLGRRGRGPYTDFEGIRFASIGPITSATLRELGLPVDIEAAEFTIPGLIRAIELDLAR
jgi:uroporphyrinogen-III synthase